MEHRRHKPKRNYVFIFTSDDTDGVMRQFRISRRTFRVLVFVLCAVLGAAIGLIYNAVDVRREDSERISQLEYEVSLLNEQKEELEVSESSLESELTGLNEQIDALSQTISQQAHKEEELSSTLNEQYIPSGYPLTGSASVKESSSEDESVCVFSVSPGSAIVAAGSGTVTAINDDVEYGNNVWVDHGNGYITVYRNQGEVYVNPGDSVVQGTTIFIVGSSNTDFGYQVMLDGVYIDPMELLSITG